MFLHGETKHNLGLVQEAYQCWNEVIDLHDIMLGVSYSGDRSQSVGIGHRERISDMVRTMTTKCGRICLAFARDSISVNWKLHYAEQALRHCSTTDDWAKPSTSKFFAELRRGIYTDMLKAYSILDDDKRDDGLVQDTTDAAVHLRVGTLIHMDSWSGTGVGFSKSGRFTEYANVFMRIMQEVDPVLHEQIRWDGRPACVRPEYQARVARAESARLEALIRDLQEAHMRNLL